MQSSFGATRAYPGVGQEQDIARPERPAAEAWAHLLAHTVSHRFFTLTGDEATAPRASDGALTQQSPLVDGEGATPGSFGGGGNAAAVPNHISGGIDAGDLGQLRFSITRGPEGLELVLALESVEQRELAQLESRSLVSALEASGLKVRSLVIADSQGSGTALAHRFQAGANGASRPNSTLQHSNQARASRAYRNRPNPDANESELDLLG
jgi:hypothetical protein